MQTQNFQSKKFSLVCLVISVTLLSMSYQTEGIETMLHNSIHDEFMKDKVINVQPQRLLGNSEKAWRPMRILWDWSLVDQWLADNTTAEKTRQVEYMKDIMETVGAYFRDRFLVNSPETMKVYSGTCFYGKRASDQLRGTEQATDMVILMHPIENAGYYAAAGACVTEGGSGRPTMGAIMINWKYMKPSDMQSYYDSRVFIHEFMHVMGFTGGFMRDQGLTGQIQHGGETRWAVTHPHVVEYAKQYFNCTSIEGIPIEDGGSSGSAGSHWEKTLFPAEVMNPGVMAPARISEFTVRVFEALGWYKGVNAHQEYTYLKGDGCHTIVGGECNANKSGEFCSKEDQGKDHCFPNRLGKAHCDGWAMFTGQCKYIAPTSNAWCTVEDSSNRKNFNFESYGPHSRCFMAEKSSGNMDAACLRTRCTATAVEIQIGSDVHVCNGSGPQQVNTQSFKGIIDCPAFSEMCDEIMEERCPMDCYGQGMCMHNNTCQCLNGFSGDDCNAGYPNEQDPFVTSFDIRNGKKGPEDPEPKPEKSESEAESQSESDADDKDDEEDEKSFSEDEEEPEERPLSQEALELMASIEKLQKSHDHWKIKLNKNIYNIQKYHQCLTLAASKKHAWCKKASDRNIGYRKKNEGTVADRAQKIEAELVKLEGLITARQWEEFLHDQEAVAMMRESHIAATMTIWYASKMGKYESWKNKWQGHVDSYNETIKKYEGNTSKWAQRLVDRLKARVANYQKNVAYYKDVIELTELKMGEYDGSTTGSVKIPDDKMEEYLREGTESPQEILGSNAEKNGEDATARYSN